MRANNVQKSGLATWLCRTIFLLGLAIGGWESAFGQRVNSLTRVEELTKEGDRLVDEKQYQRAIDQFNFAIRIIPNYAPAYAGKGRAYFIMKQYDSARGQLLMALRYNHSDPAWINWLIGYSYLQEGNATDALKWCSDAVFLDSTDNRYRMTKGKAHYELKQYKDAREESLKVLTSEPNNVEAGLLAGNSAYNLKDFRGAADAYRRVAQPTAEFANVYYWLGNAYVNMSEDPNAIWAFQWAIHLKSEFSADAFVNVGFAHYRQKRFEEAFGSFQNAVRLQADNIDAYRGMSLAKVRVCEYSAAIGYERKVVELAPPQSSDRGGAYVNLSWYYSFIGENSLAADAGRQATYLRPKDYMGYTNLCRALNDLKLHQEAIDACRTALSFKPGDGETL